jgi:hypothetical protein
MKVPVPCTHPHYTPCVQLCCEAHNRIIEIINRGELPFPDDYLIEEGMNQNQQHMRALEITRHTLSHDPGAAYRAEMPIATNREQIQDYIACVLHGLAIGAIDQDLSTKLLYGAQISIGALPKQAKEKRTHIPTPSPISPNPGQKPSSNSPSNSSFH